MSERPGMRSVMIKLSPVLLSHRINDGFGGGISSVVNSFGKSVYPNSPGKKQISGFGLPPIAVVMW